jgi:hypothetical protein
LMAWRHYTFQCTVCCVLSRSGKKDQQLYVIAKAVRKSRHSRYNPVVAVAFKFDNAAVGLFIGVG